MFLMSIIWGNIICCSSQKKKTDCYHLVHFLCCLEYALAHPPVHESLSFPAMVTSSGSLHVLIRCNGIVQRYQLNSTSGIIHSRSPWVGEFQRSLGCVSGCSGKTANKFGKTFWQNSYLLIRIFESSVFLFSSEYRLWSFTASPAFPAALFIEKTSVIRI